MMPGENQSKIAGIASDATAGTCQNCTVLQQNVNEYVAALLSLKQKVIDTDRLLTEYEAKCDELQKCQRESNELHQQLDELLDKMVPLEKRSKEYEVLRSELEEKKSTLKMFEQRSMEVDVLREENSKTVAQNINLETQLQKLEEMTVKQRQEGEKLKMEKEGLERESQKMQSSLKQYQQAASEVESFKAENATILAEKENLERQLQMFKDSSVKQTCEIEELKLDKQGLERKLWKAEKHVEKLEREKQKDTRSASVQTNSPREPMVDKSKVKLLLEELWKCVEPQYQQTSKLLTFSDGINVSKESSPKGIPGSPFKIQNCRSPSRGSCSMISCSLSAEKKALEKLEKRDRATKEHFNAVVAVDGRSLLPAREFASVDLGSSPPVKEMPMETEVASLEEIMDWFRPLPSLLSPISSPYIKEVVFGPVSESSDDEEEATSVGKMGRPVQMLDDGTDDPSSVKSKSADLQHLSSLSKDQTVEPTSVSQEDTVSTLAESSESPCAKESISIGKKFDRLETFSNEKVMMLEETLQQDSGMHAIHGSDKTFMGILPNGHKAEDHKENHVVSGSTSELWLQCTGNTEYTDSDNDIVMELCTPLKVCRVISDPLEDVSIPLALCNEMEVKQSANETIENGMGESAEPLEEGVVTELRGSETLLKGGLKHKENGVCLNEISPGEDAALLYADNETIGTVQVRNSSLQPKPILTAASEISQPSNVPFNKEDRPDNKLEHLVCGGVENYIPEKDSAKIESGKADELLSDALKLSPGLGCSLQSQKVPDSKEAAKKVREDCEASCVVPFNPDSSPVHVSVEATSEDLASNSESSDESFKLHRKAKMTHQRTSSQISSEQMKDLRSEARWITCDDRETIHGSLKEHINHAPSDEPCKTDANFSTILEMKRTKSDLKNCASKAMMIETDLVLENHEMVNYSESSSEEVRLQDQNHSDKVSLQPQDEMADGNSFSSSAGTECILVSAPDFQRGGEETDKSAADEKVSCRRCESINETLDGENSERFSENSTQNETSKECIVPGHMSQCSGNGQEVMKVTMKAEESIILSPSVQVAVMQSMKVTMKGEESIILSPSVQVAEAPGARSPECIRKVRSEMGPPLPPLLPPLTATPTKPCTHDSSSSFIPGKLSFSSPKHELSSPRHGKVVPPPFVSPLTGGPKDVSPSLAPQSPSDTKCERILSSPLQFCSATPKHAVPVPGRFPPSALSTSSASPTATQENSVRILDTMYPELSARARTLNILRGNVTLSRPVAENGKAVPVPVNQITGYKSINSSSTAFTKTGKSYEPDSCSAEESMENARKLGCTSTREETRKRPGVNVLLPVSAKRLRLEDGTQATPSIAPPTRPLGDQEKFQQVTSQVPKEDLQPECPQDVSVVNGTVEIISKALTKIGTSCFDVLPVIRSHLKIGRISKVPVLRDEEREVIREFCGINKSLADEFLSAVLSKMKSEKDTLSADHMQCLCRVYTGLCRQRDESERVHLFAYCILKEDFPESAKLILFVVTTWYNILFPHSGIVCNAMHAVIKERADGEVLECLTKYLDWEMNPPCDIEKIIMKTLIPLQMGVNMTFQQHERHGDDLNRAAWEYVYALDLLCTQKKWNWTYENLISKELWPVMNKWVTQPRNQPPSIPDVSVASVLRLIGRLGQLGIKERSIVSVRNVAKVINTFGRHGQKEGVPWAVQLAAVYTIYDLSPCNPKEAMETLAAWRGETTHPVAPAVTSCITQLGSICRQVKS
ncbi:little elongation complex subunit 1 [Brienomyrus brachyistius]|uniref:little elongation complex subunit 1 n=1 Tax=Brienomyrus brachyistius TaxID=42636 RepID=UPI0020B21BD1|nr:little elongation complex subunit 1 [Brienomyrus brachyistius]